MEATALAFPAGKDRQTLGRVMRIFHQFLEKADLFVRFFMDVGKDIGETHCRDRGHERQDSDKR